MGWEWWNLMGCFDPMTLGWAISMFWLTAITDMQAEGKDKYQLGNEKVIYNHGTESVGY